MSATLAGSGAGACSSEYEYARLLIARGSPEPQKVAALLGEAARLAYQIGLRALHGHIEELSAPRLPRPDQSRNRVNSVISEHTAAKHISNILTKTDCANRTEAASYAHRHALVDE